HRRSESELGWQACLLRRRRHHRGSQQLCRQSGRQAGLAELRRLLPLRILVRQLELQLCLGLLTRTRSLKRPTLPRGVDCRLLAEADARRVFLLAGRAGRRAANGREFPLRDAEPIGAAPAGAAFAAAALAAAGIVCKAVDGVGNAKNPNEISNKAVRWKHAWDPPFRTRTAMYTFCSLQGRWLVPILTDRLTNSGS